MTKTIRLEHSTRWHPKLERLAVDLTISHKEATGLLVWLYWWTLEYGDNGNLEGYADYEIANGLDWEGDPPRLLDALRECGVLDGYRLTPWE